MVSNAASDLSPIPFLICSRYGGRMREVRLLRVKPSTLRRRQWVAQVVMLGRHHELMVMVEVVNADKVEVERIARLIAVRLRQDVLADAVEGGLGPPVPDDELALIDDALEVWYGRQWRTFTGPLAGCPQYEGHVDDSRARMRRVIAMLRAVLTGQSKESG